MIVLKSTAQLRLVFNKLIKTLSVPIDWNGNFIVSGNFLILPGKERSVIFNYDTRRVTTNLSDDKLGRKSAEPIENDSQLVNIFNLVLYAFGKWGALKGITVEKDYKKINSLFAAVFGEFGVAADYTAQHCFWYKDGTRITYEDAIQLAIDSEQQKVMDDEIAQEETGLWHSTVWKVEEEQFKFEKLPMSQRRKGRIGHNFYKVGYDCPHCNGKLYMASFSKKEKPVIDTVEGRVQLARAFFCPECVIFYTPLPDAGLEDEEVYCLDFDGDTTAGNDYMEMLGRLGTKEPNSEFNRYVDRVKDDADFKKRENLNDIDKGISDDRRSLNGIDKGIYDDDRDLNGIDKGIRDDRRSLSGIDKGIRDDERDLNGIDKGIRDDERDLNGIDKGIRDDERDLNGIDKGIRDDERDLNGIDKGIRDDERDLNGIDKGIRDDERDLNGIDKGIRDDRRSLNGIDKGIRDDRRSLNGIDKGIRDDRRSLNGIDKGIRDDERDLNGIDKGIGDDRRSLNGIDKGIYDDEPKSLNSTEKSDDEEYALDSSYDEAGASPKRWEKEINAGSSEVSRSEMNDESDRRFGGHNTEKDKKNSGIRLLRNMQNLFKKIFAVTKIFANIKSDKNDNPEEKSFGAYSDDRWQSEEIGDNSPMYAVAHEPDENSEYNDDTEQTGAERQKAQELVEQSEKNTRSDLLSLIARIKDRHFKPKVEKEYVDKIQDEIAGLDKRRIDEACEGYLDYNGDELKELYDRIDNEDFLPEIKKNALYNISKRLWKIRNEEAELLVKRLKKALEENGVSDDKRLYFYPAREVLENCEDTLLMNHFECAKTSYAPDIEQFEYPIMMVDVTRKQNGRRGMLLTPDAIYYGNLYTYGRLSVEDIEKIQVNTGFMGRHVAAYLAGGSRRRLADIADSKESEAYAKTLDDFAAYLKEKPFSRKEKYLVKQKHDVICCFRCGYVYKNMRECPKCGYKFNS